LHAPSSNPRFRGLIVGGVMSRVVCRDISRSTWLNRYLHS